MIYIIDSFDIGVLFFLIVGFIFFFMIIYFAPPYKTKNESIILPIICLVGCALSFIAAGILIIDNLAVLDNDPNYYCPQHPNECVLELNCSEGYMLDGWDNYCSKLIRMNRTKDEIIDFTIDYKTPIKNYRFKTDCEKNSRENADCVCDKYIFDMENGKTYKCNDMFIFLEYNKNNTVSLTPNPDGSVKCIETELPCVKSHVRTPAERCEYFNRTPVYDLNNTNVLGCV